MKETTPQKDTTSLATGTEKSEAVAASSSTKQIMGALSSYSPNQQLYLHIKTLLTSELRADKKLKLTTIIESCIRLSGADLLVGCSDVESKAPASSMLKRLSDYYEKNKQDDRLKRLLDKSKNAEAVIAFCQKILKFRPGDSKSKAQFKLCYEQTENEHSDGTLNVFLRCENMGEAALVAAMMHAVLQEKCGLPARLYMRNLPIWFVKDEESGVLVILVFRSVAYRAMYTENFSLDIEDQLLRNCFKDHRQNYYDYWKERAGVIEPLPASECEPKRLTPEIQALALASIHTPSLPKEELVEVEAKMFVFTSSWLGFGNYINAFRSLESLCERMPKLQINWVVETGGQILPEINLPPQVQLHTTDKYWKSYPLIQSLSGAADIIVSMPNDFLFFYQNQLPDTPLFLNESTVLRVSEYNHHAESHAGQNCLGFESGINQGATSLGILKPAELEGCSGTLKKQRQLICQDKQAASIFSSNPEASCYFAYVFYPKPTDGPGSVVAGIEAMSVFALFIQHAKEVEHAKQSGSAAIKVIMPLTPEVIADAIAKYPHIFEKVSVSYQDAAGSLPIKSGAGAGIIIEVINCFPLKNETFRLVMNYAARFNTPVVTTGDQSFIEMFYTLPPQSLFIYQVLEHKKALLGSVKKIVEENNWNHLLELIRCTETGDHSEEDLVDLAQFLRDSERELKKEFIGLCSIIKAQPDLIENFSKVIAVISSKQKELIPIEAAGAASMATPN